MTVKENGMTVRELMEFLEKQNPDAIISIGFSCECGQAGGGATEYFELDVYYSKTLKSDVVNIDCTDDGDYHDFIKKKEAEKNRDKTYDNPMDKLREKLKQKA